MKSIAERIKKNKKLNISKVVEKVKTFPKVVARKILADDIETMQRLHQLDKEAVEKRCANYIETILLKPKVRIRRVVSFCQQHDRIPFEISWGIPDNIARHIKVWSYRVTIGSHLYELLKYRGEHHKFLAERIIPDFLSKFREQIMVDIDE